MWSKFSTRLLCNINLTYLFVFISFLFQMSSQTGLRQPPSYSTKSNNDRKPWTPPYCPPKCICGHARYDNPTYGKTMKVVDCKSAGYTSIPRNTSQEADVLVLKNNKIRILRVPESLKNLKYLDVSGNRIYRMESLQNLNRLKSLNLKSNNLGQLQNGQFSGLKYLIKLDLSSNYLRIIEKHAFGGLNHLQILYLDKNNISVLQKQWFLYMTSLIGLFLSHNSLKDLDSPNMFQSLRDLTTLKVNYNRIRYIHEKAFHGLDKLTALDISYNKLKVVPADHIQKLRSLQYVYINGNPIYKIDTGAFSNMSLLAIKASYMPELTVIEPYAFTNLTSLKTLELHDNMALVFVDPHAFHNMPNLRNLYLHNNRLVTLSENIYRSLPSLTNCHFYNNQMRCDCNLRWIKQELVKAQQPNYTTVLYDQNVFICNSPEKLMGRLLAEVPESSINKECAPLALPLFEPSYNYSVGGELRLECHAIGVPEPDIMWVLPNGSVINSDMKSDRIQVVDKCNLVIQHLRISDSGRYSCKVANEKGFDMRETSVFINNKPVRIQPAGVAGDYVTIKWNSDGSRTTISDYQIHWRATSSTHHYNVIHLSPYSTSYTFSNLQPLTQYEFCIVYVYEKEMYTVDCSNVTTTELDNFKPGITRIDKRVVVGVCAVVVLTIILGCVITVAQRFHKRKEYLEPTTVDKIDPSAQIPLDNFYNPSTPYLCSSRTSLISAQD